MSKIKVTNIKKPDWNVKHQGHWYKTLAEMYGFMVKLKNFHPFETKVKKYRLLTFLETERKISSILGFNGNILYLRPRWCIRYYFPFHYRHAPEATSPMSRVFVWPATRSLCFTTGCTWRLWPFCLLFYTGFSLIIPIERTLQSEFTASLYPRFAQRGARLWCLKMINLEKHE